MKNPSSNHAAQDIPQQDVLVHGGGNSAKIAALCLSAAGFRVALHDAPTMMLPDWQSVLALSPASRVMLETLDIWQKLDQPSMPIADMRVYARPTDTHADALLPASLGFGTAKNSAADAVEVLAHIVSLASLGRALSAALESQIEAGHIVRLPCPMVDFNPKEKIATLADGTYCQASLLVDTQKTASPWRQKAAARPLRHNYQAAALVGQLRQDTPASAMAQQMFLPSGPLALLPLPKAAADTASVAMVWSLPKARAEALSKVDPDVVAHELQKATQRRFGGLTVEGTLAVQDLQLQLAEDFVEGPIVLLGEAAHVVHPLAGQGFNLTLRDASLLADILFETRQLGLALTDGAMLASYETARRADAKLIAAPTHGLANLFGGPMAGLARLGLALTGRRVARDENLRSQLNQQANSGLSLSPQGVPLARLMRGQRFYD